MNQQKEKSQKPNGFVLIILFVVGGLVLYFIWSTFFSARFSALGACPKDEGCLFTAVNGNRTVRVIGFSADGSRFLTDGTADGIIHDGSNGRKVATLDEGTENHFYDVSGDHSEITAIHDGVIKFFDWDGELIRTWTPDEGHGARDVAMVPLVNGFVIAEKSGVSLWNMSDGSLITYLTEGGSYMQVTASTDGEFVAGYDFVDDTLTVWPLQDLDRTFTISNLNILFIHLSNNGSRLAAGGPDGAFVWDTANGSLLSSINPDGLDVTASALSEDGTKLAAGIENGDVVVLDIPTNQIVASYSHEYSADRIIFNREATNIAVGLNFDVTVSGGGLIFEDDSYKPGYEPGQNITQSDNRITVTPGYAIVWSVGQ